MHSLAARSRRLGSYLIVAMLVAAPAAAAQDTAPKTGEPWQIIPLPQSTLVYARDGSLIGEIGREMRTSVSIKTLPAYVGQAFIAVEDKRFYEHDGVDIKSTAAAALHKIVGGNRGGGSTITQQLVGYMHPDIIDRSVVDGAAGFARKFHEQEAAREMEKHYSKAQILEGYLNVINLGHGWYGVEAAARHYFGKHASQLTVPEAATLAALPKSQPQWDPLSHPAASRARRNLILGMMAEQGFIDSARAEKFKAEPLVTAPNLGMAAASNYFVDAVKQQAERAAVPVQNGGYAIYTTLDPVLQRDAVSAVVEGTAKIEAQKGYRHLTYATAKKTGDPNYLQGMAIAIDPFTGDVRALVGGRDYARAPFNRAISALRQPGSSFKPIVYSKAIEDSIPANTVIPDSSLEIDLPSGDVYKPQEADGKFWGMYSMRDGQPDGLMTMREGLKHSRNAVAIQLGMRVGMDSVAALAQRFGITTKIDPVPASAIGASAVHPIDMVAAYTAFANNGAVVQPRFITLIRDVNGRTIYLGHSSTPQQVLDPRVAFIMRDMMRDGAEHGTGYVARRLVPDNIPIAGKTGTTNDNVDLWFIGMTPDLVAGVWLGFDRPKPIASAAVASTLAAPIWGTMMGRYYAGKSTAGWGPPPDGLVYAELDRDTAQPATPATQPDRRYVEYFLPGTEPVELRNNPWRVTQWGPLFLPTRPW